MDIEPAISIALAVHNGENYLSAALESVLAQDFENFEIIVSNSGSTDATAGILARFARRDPRVRVLPEVERLTQAGNFNRAIEHCRSQWIKLFCHDDLMMPNCLAAIVAAIRSDDSPRLGLIGNNENWLFANGVQSRVCVLRDSAGVVSGRTLIQEHIAGRAPIPLPAMTNTTMRKAAWDAAGRFDGRWEHLDTFLWHRLLVNWDYIWLPEVLTVTRIHSGQVTSAIRRRSFRSIEDHRQFWPEFIAEYGETLEIDRKTQWRLLLKPLTYASADLAAELLMGHYRSAVRSALRLPPRWWPLLPGLTARAFWNERKKVDRIGPSVPTELIYP